MIPERNDAAKFSKSVFFEEYNDVDIYIEDTAAGYEKLFVEIFSRLFKDEYKISNVFPLGCRKSVVDKCKESQGKFVRPSLYVVDGDMFLITSEERIMLDGLFELPMYSIENILIDENALLEILNEEDEIKSKDLIKSELNFTGWIEENSNLMADLFVEYAICFALCPEIKTVSFPVRSLVSSDKGELDEIKVNDRILELKTKVIDKVGEQKYNEHKRAFSFKVDGSANSITKYVSGKDYLLPLLLTRSRSIVRTKAKNINLKIRLAMKCSLESLSEGKKYVAG